MRRVLRILIILSMLQGLSMLGAATVVSQTPRVAGCRYFSETGHNVRGEFLSFFDRFGGVAIFGQPRTEAFVQDGLTVQYFERARMELHPSNPLQYRVQLTLIGDLLGYRQPAIPSHSIPPFNHPQRRYYPQTGHTLSYVFLRYYDAHGGLDVFGYPITEMIAEDGLVVQYFQRGKMEWHPENPLSSQVTLGNLGDEYIAHINLSPRYLAAVQSVCSSAPVRPTATSRMPPTLVPQPPVSTPVSRPTAVVPAPPATRGPGELGGAVQPATAVPTVQAPTQRPTIAPTSPTSAADFSVSATVKYRTTGQGGTQTVYARAVDSKGRGIANCSVEAVVDLQPEDVIVRGTTDSAGFCSLSFNIGFPPPGYTVMIEVRFTQGGRTQTAKTSFLVW